MALSAILASLSHCPSLCFSLDIFVRFLPTSPWCNFLQTVISQLCLSPSHYLPFLPSFTFLSNPQFLWFHPLTLQRLFFFFFFQKSLMTYLSNPVTLAELRQFWPSLFCSLSFLTFWLHSAFTLFSSCVWNAGSNCRWWISDSCIPEGKTNKQTNTWCAMLSDFYVKRCLAPWSMVLLNIQA